MNEIYSHFIRAFQFDKGTAKKKNTGLRENVTHWYRVIPLITGHFSQPGFISSWRTDDDHKIFRNLKYYERNESVEFINYKFN